MSAYMYIRNRAISLMAIVTLAIVLWPQYASAGFIYDHLLAKDPTISKSDDRRYALYVPSAYSGQRAVPLVVALHGCQQKERTVADKSRFDEVAEREGFIVVYPYIAKSDQSGDTNDEGGRNPRCWGFWFSDEIHRGSGEVGDIARLVDHVKTLYNIDPNRIHIIGLSSGGAMTTDALVAYPDKFASGAVLDGVGYAETSSIFTGFLDCDTVLNNNLGTVRPNADVIRDMRTEMRKSVLRQVPIMVVHNKKDCTVPFKVGDAIAQQFAGLMQQEGKAVDLANPVASESGTAGGIPWSHNKYGAGPLGESLIETLYIDAYYADLQRLESRLSSNEYFPQGPAPNDIDRGHAWFGAKRGPWFLTVGPNTTEAAWAFFKNHPLNQTQPGTPVINCDPPAVSNKSVTFACSAHDNGAIADYKLVLSGPSPANDTLPGSASFSKRYDNLADGDYRATITASDAQGHISAPANLAFKIGAAAITCITASNPEHLSNGRAHGCGWFLIRACADGSNDDLGFNFSWNTTSLRQIGDDNWTKVDSCQ